ncbi:LacI family DNA-binding transcriptional regulator [Segeticoccus rhizosphaerae]|uniref:LacI family DNA-binding transcriptional regulator n=1 Tax=Segeticoccus rhizosphaerae TaxID=1104777 RepID=UPI0010C0EA2B|nr:LacI family DNA-binding transcriptional regulator [Ornithinicoccus soli]
MTATLRDVAERAGVSIRTVSNVVNGYRHVADATRTRVQTAVDELGYRPNAAARNLRSRRTGIIALGVPELSQPYFAELADLVIDQAAAHAYTLVIEPTGGTAAGERRLAVARDSPLAYDGLILSPLALGYKELSTRDGGAPAVMLGERGTRRLFDHVGIDNVAAARAATEHLIGTGRRRLAAIGAQPGSLTNTATYRLRGFRAALDAANLPLPAERIAGVAEFGRAAGAAAMTQLLALDEPPDAVFCFNDALALGALRAASARGVRVPDDLAIVGCDDIEDSRFVTPTLTTIAPDKAEIARLAVERLIARIRGDASTPRHYPAPYTLMPRESSGP